MTKQKVKSNKAELIKADAFLPEGYKIPKKSDQFMKLTVGQHKFRIMTAPMMGFVFFAEETDSQGNKTLTPVRRLEEMGNFTPEEMIELNAKKNEKGALEGSKYFWVVLLWDYEDKRFKVLEVTQITILDSLMAFYKHPEYGDPRKYDITITRTGTTKNDTEYTVLPSPPKKVSLEIEKAFNELQFNLDALIKNEYPLVA